ncbi:hypothetical protein EXE58_03575 [Nocardioides seonyuensis]|uniref:Asparagine synthetase domain-containing protein n=1 Tax=Nocardioides seonyuensis TaxID=2518371 RepID=A0A4P7IC26_9ACTN|nr:hypothetical protein [Nocardioides seonyuensis]QBX54638.1 hypothetical protein EXE58_03575 [Nocardioides seonyuensis]
MPSPAASIVRDPAFRRQFVMGPDFSDLLPQWRRHWVANGLALSVHPDLPVTRVDAGARSIVLLGFVLDPRHPERDDQTILDEVVRESHTFDEVLRAFDPLAGRWAALWLHANGAHVFHDPAALRQVYHGRDSAGALWCGSSPSLISRVAGHAEDVVHREEMVRDGLLDPGTTHFWPGTGSSFVGIERLLPNHHLDVRTGEVRRYWPHAPIPPVDPDVATARCASMLTGVIAAAAERYPLALAVTAGFDSRILLAASRPRAERLSFYTLKKVGTSRHGGDVRVPHQMLRKVGLRHRVIPVSPTPHGQVFDTIRDTFVPCHRSTASSAQALHDHPPRSEESWVTINGNVSEVTRRRNPYARLSATPPNFARAARMSGSSLAMEQLAAWWAGAVPAVEVSGVDGWDLYYWEQPIGGWLATVRTEFDVVEEGLTPYNCRSLLTTMMGVDSSLRGGPDFPFHRGLIAHMWPELLDHPINPPVLRTRVRQTLRGKLLHRSRPGESSSVGHRVP